jgi:hypothetical protein
MERPSRDEVARGHVFDLLAQNAIRAGLPHDIKKDGNVQIILPLPLLESGFLCAVGRGGG